MAQPVKLSDDLVLDARLTGDASERSIAGQVEYWARLGRAAESLMRVEQVLLLKRRGDARLLSACLAAAETPEGKQRLATYLDSRPYPHFEPATGRPGLLVKIDEDGTRTVGRFMQRVFTAVDAG